MGVGEIAKDHGLILAMRPLIVPGSCNHNCPIYNLDHTKIMFFLISSMPPDRKSLAKKAKTSMRRPSRPCLP